MLAIRNLANQIVDYAGLFPPAGLPMKTVVENYSRYVSGPNRWMLSRLIVPAARLGEFESFAEPHLPGEGEPWRISALVPPVDAPEQACRYAFSGIQQFNERHLKPGNGLAVVDVVEIKAPKQSDIAEIAKQLPIELAAFIEIPHDEDPTSTIQELVDVSRSYGDCFFAKIRTGGVTPELIPGTLEVARFLLACGEHLVPLKATAGLHHPLRNEFNLTYESDAPRGTMHGFLNVFIAACFAYSSISQVEPLQAILEETSIDAFEINDQGIRWREHFISATRISRIREKFATSFGSCSFDEPTGELEALGFQAAFASAR